MNRTENILLSSLHKKQLMKNICQIILLLSATIVRLTQFRIYPAFMSVIVITVYSPSCLGQETVKKPFGLRVKLPPDHLSTTRGGGLFSC